jgi:hypothetical protein
MTRQYAEIYRTLGDLIHKFNVTSGTRPECSHAQGVRMRRQVAKDDGQDRTP